VAYHGTARRIRHEGLPSLIQVVWAPLRDLGVCESGDVGGVELLVLDRGAQAQGAVVSLPIVEDLQVLKDCGGQLEAGGPPLTVEEFGLHAGPEGFDHGIVVGVADGAPSRAAARSPWRAE